MDFIVDIPVEDLKAITECVGSVAGEFLRLFGRNLPKDIMDFIGNLMKQFYAKFSRKAFEVQICLGGVVIVTFLFVWRQTALKTAAKAATTAAAVEAITARHDKLDVSFPFLKIIIGAEERGRRGGGGGGRER